jgi:hypothetical protein
MGAAMPDNDMIAVEMRPEVLTVHDFRQVQTLLGGQGFQMVSFEMDGFFARFDAVRHAHVEDGGPAEHR